jgi:hypothetical protein
MAVRLLPLWSNVELSPPFRRILMSHAKRNLMASVRKHAKAATLAASLVPVAALAMTPVTVSAQCNPASGSCPTTVPEPATILMLGAGVASVGLAAIRRRRNNK